MTHVDFILSQTAGGLTARCSSNTRKSSKHSFLGKPFASCPLVLLLLLLQLIAPAISSANQGEVYFSIKASDVQVSQDCHCPRVVSTLVNDTNTQVNTITINEINRNIGTGSTMAAQGMEGDGQDASSAGRPERAAGFGALAGEGWGLGTPQEGPSAVPGHEGAARVAKDYIGAAGDKGVD